jgi:uridine kinase
MNETIIVNVLNGEKEEVTKGTTLIELAKKYEKDFKLPIVLGVIDNNLSELNKKLDEDCTVEFIDITNKDGFRTYLRSLSLLLIKAIRDVIGEDNLIKVIIQYSINKGFYCDIKSDVKINDTLAKSIKERMDEMVKEDIPFVKTTVKTDQARKIFEEQQMYDKLELFKFRRVSNVNLYSLDGVYDYFYGYMAPSTGYVSCYDIIPYDGGIILQFMDIKHPGQVLKFDPDKKLFNTMKETSKWGEIMKVETVGALNNTIVKGKINELILVSEALMEKKIGAIADKIMEDISNKKFIFIAGPSSSGKTTFAHRLAIQLRAQGVNPVTISVDNYFVDREKTPKDENGNYNFECLEAIDVEKFNKDMTDLLLGKTIDMPVFNFISGKREYKGDFLTLEDNDVLVIEGIHGLNPRLSFSIPEGNKFKIYISALTQLNIDDHNRIPTTDARLIRRIVRDSQYRGASAQKTISMWPSVRRGEDQYIFPFQEEADIMFNSALVYELSVLKQYAEPLLFNVPRDCKEYIEAKRLIKFLDYFLGVTSEKIPNNSLIREFVGGSCFR